MTIDTETATASDEAVENAYFRIIKNAERLAADARLLHEHERFASSIALSVLAVEEVGKIFAIDAAAEKAKLADHSTKRQAVAKVFQEDLDAAEGLVIWLNELERKGLHPPHQGCSITVAPRPADYSKSRFLQHIGQGGDPKNNALYVDIARDGSWNVASDPAHLTEAEAVEWLDIVAAALSSVSPTLWAIFGE